MLHHTHAGGAALGIFTIQEDSCPIRGHDLYLSYSFLSEDAHGNLSDLDSFGVPVGGDQLTRVRLEDAKSLRNIAPSPRKRFDHLHPFVIEWWHNKQDFLEKAYKTLYNTKSLRQPGTLYFYKCKLHISDVNGKVKSNFKAHHSLLITVGKHMMIEQILEYFRMDDTSSNPARNVPQGVDAMTSMQRKEATSVMTKEFLDTYGYGDFDGVINPQTSQPSKTQMTQYRVIKVLADGRFVVEPLPVPPEPKPDRVYNYSMNLCHWALHLMELNDTAKEADTERLLANCRYSIPFFYAHSRLSKYMVENMDFLLKVEHLLSPLQRNVVLDAAFVNCRGGAGNSVEADLVQDHSVRNQKTLIRQLGANKTEQAIIRATGSADALCHIVDDLRISLSIRTKSSRHSRQIMEKDTQLLTRTLRQLRPFNKVPGRECEGFPAILSSPFHKIKKNAFQGRLKHVLERLKRGQIVRTEDADDGDTNEVEEQMNIDAVVDLPPLYIPECMYIICTGMFVEFEWYNSAYGQTWMKFDRVERTF